MLPHEREEYQQQMGHVWLGFSEEQIVAVARPSAGFGDVRVRTAAGRRATRRGPALFVSDVRRIRTHSNEER